MVVLKEDTRSPLLYSKEAPSPYSKETLPLHGIGIPFLIRTLSPSPCWSGGGVMGEGGGVMGQGGGVMGGDPFQE